VQQMVINVRMQLCDANQEFPNTDMKSRTNTLRQWTEMGCQIGNTWRWVSYRSAYTAIVFCLPLLIEELEQTQWKGIY